MPPAPANLVVAPFCEERLEQLRRGALVDTAVDFGPVMAARAVEDTRLLMIDNRGTLIEVGKVSQKKSLHWKWIRYRDGIWIPHRKRTYLYWFKFLQEAESSPDFSVNWSKYRGWGGANEVMRTRFDDWWEDHWKDLFGVEGIGDCPSSYKLEQSTA